MIFIKISIIGGGYVGLVSAACFSALNHDITLIEIDQTKIDLINRGKLPIYETGLEKLVFENLNKNLKITSDYKAIIDSEIILICVGTPQSANGSADLSMIKSAAHSIGQIIQSTDKYCVVAIKSTVPPGTTENLLIPIISHYKPNLVGFVMNPEFLREGLAVSDFMNPDRIVIGEFNKEAGDLFKQIYNNFKCPIIRTSLAAAEMIKYTANAFLATKISFANEIGNICKQLNIDVYDVMKGVGLDHRINPYFLDAGVGFGGSCFPKDVSALIQLAKTIYIPTLILNAVMEINKLQPLVIIKQLQTKVGTLDGKKIAVLGLAFKADTDDARESSAISVIKQLQLQNAKVFAYDPKANLSMSKIIPNINYCENVLDALKDADACLVLTDWLEFAFLDKEFDLMKSRIIIEGRKILKCSNVEGICW